MNLLRSLAITLALRSVGAILSHAAVATFMAVLWFQPLLFGRAVVEDVEFLLVLEFLVLHSTAFLVGFRFMKDFPRWVFIVVYAPFGLLLAFSMSSPWVGVMFFWHLASSVWGDFDMADRNIGGFLVRYLPAFLWFAAVPFVVILLRLPAVGWEQYPGLWFRWDNGFQSAALLPAWATLYFTGRAIWEFAVRRWDENGTLDRFIEARRA